MKLLVRCVVLGLLVLAAVGCGGVDNSTSQPENVGPPPAAAPSSDAPEPMVAPTP